MGFSTCLASFHISVMNDSQEAQLCSPSEFVDSGVALQLKIPGITQFWISPTLTSPSSYGRGRRVPAWLPSSPLLLALLLRSTARHPLRLDRKTAVTPIQQPCSETLDNSQEARNCGLPEAEVGPGFGVRSMSRSREKRRETTTCPGTAVLESSEDCPSAACGDVSLASASVVGEV